MRFRFVGGLLVAFLAAVAGVRAQIPGRNVNMVAGAGWPDGDPMLQRQNEPSVAASTRNPLHLLGGANDYRTVDLPGLPDGEETGDAWLGLFKSTDGGQRWTSNLLPGYPQDTSAAGNASPIKGYQAGADPVVRAGSNGLLYYSGLVFDRVENGRSAIVVARFIDNNNQEAGDPIKYIATSVVASNTGAGGEFLDKPWMAVDIPRSAARTCVITTPGESGDIEQRLPAGRVYVAYSIVSEDAMGPRSEIYLASSTTCGRTWSTPQRISRAIDRVNQGATIAIDPRNGRVHVTWRRFDLSGDNDAMMLASNSGPGQPFSLARIIRRFQKFGPGQRDIWRVFEHRIKRRHGQDTAGQAAPPAGELQVDHPSSWWHRLLPWLRWVLGGWRVSEVENIAPFDQGTSAIDLSFRTNAYPTLAIDGTGRLYMAWTERGFATHPDAGNVTTGDARIVMTTSANGTTWTPPQTVAEYGQRGHQLMPSLTFAGGRLMLVYYDLIEDRSSVFERFVDDLTSIVRIGRRHTLDIRVSMGAPGAAPVFEPSVRVSDYMMGARSATGPIEQLQVNPPNLPMFRLGTAPFFGDYIDITAAPTMIPDGAGGWRFNTDAGTTLPVFHAVWTDNRDVRPPTADTNADDNPWNDYIPPIFPGRPEQSRIDPAVTVAECNATNSGNAGSRNQNIYTSRITGGLLVGSPGNTKPLSTDLQRAFVVFVQNTSAQTRSFRLTILNQPPGGRASFDQFPLPSSPPPLPPPLTVLDLTIGPRSSGSRTVYVTSSDPRAAINIDVAEIAMPGAPGEIPGGLEGRIILNPDLLNPEIENPEIENPEIENPEIENAEVYNPEIENPEIENPEIENPEIENPEIENPEIENPEIENIRVANPEIDNPEIENVVILNPEIENPEIENPEIENPEIENGTVTDITWTITNNGNTTAAFNVNVFLQGQQASLPPGMVTQLIIYKTYKTPVVDQCDLKTVTQNVLIANIPSPDIIAAGDGFHDANDPSEKNATLWLEPGGLVEVHVLLRVFDPDRSNNVIIDGASIDPGVIPQEDVDLVLQQQSVDSEDAENGVTEPPITTTTGSTVFFLNQPANAVPNMALQEIGVQVRDTAGAVMPGAVVTMALGENPTGASLLGTTTAIAGPDGIARFTSLALDRVGFGYTLIASVVGLPPVETLPFAVGEACVASGLSPVARYRVSGPGNPDRPKFIRSGVSWNPDVGQPPNHDALVVTEAGTYHAMQNRQGGLFVANSGGTGPGGAAGVAVGDFNGDGQSDVLVSKGAANTVAFLPIVQTAPGALSQIPVGGTAGAIAAGHLNADVHLDFAVVRASDIAIFFGDGTGSFAAGPALGPSIGLTDVQIGDVDGDDDFDVLAAFSVVSPGPGSVVVFRNDGGAAFTQLAPLPVGGGPRTLITHDFDHDGHLDYATADHDGAGGVSVRFGDGTGAFPRTAAIGLGFGPDGLTAGDFNADGLGDIAITQASANRIEIWFARPGPVITFDNPRSFATDPGPVSLATDDFNGDGRADIVSANRSAGAPDDLNTVSVLLGACGALTADLQLQLTEDQDPVAVGSPLTHTATVSNAGPFAASAVRLVIQSSSVDLSGEFIAGLPLASATPTQGTCIVNLFFGTHFIECDLGTIAAGASASLSLAFTAPALPAVRVFSGGEAVAAEVDFNPIDNVFQILSTDIVPVAPGFPIAIDTVALAEGSSFFVESGGVPVVPTTAVGGVTGAALVPGAYRLHAPWGSTTAIVDFTVTAAGLIDFAPALDAYVSGRGTATLIVRGHPIRVDTLQLRARPQDNGSGDLFVSSVSTNQILRYSGQTGAFVGVFVEHASLQSPGGFVFGPDGHLYVVGFISGNIVRFDGQTGAFIDEFVSAGSGGLSNLGTITFGPDGHLYAVSAGAHEVLRFNGQTGAFMDAFVSGGSGGLQDPYDLKFGPDGRLYVSGLPTDSVFRYDGVTGAFVDTIGPGSGLQFPGVLTFGPDGHLYVSSSGSGAILRFDISTGAFIDVFVPSGSGGMSLTQGISFGPDGHLYLADNNGVLKYDGSTGAFIGPFVADGSGGLTLAAFNSFRQSTPYPAPGSYMLLSNDLPATIPHPSGSLLEFGLLPGDYRFRAPWASSTAWFDFSITPAGAVDFAPALDGFVSGRGTSTLTIGGHPIAIDTSTFDPVVGYMVLSDGLPAFGVIGAGGTVTAGLLPGTYTLSLPWASATATFDFTVTAAGTVDYNPALDAFVSGRGTTTLVVLGYPIDIDTTAIQPTSGYFVLSTTPAAGVRATGVVEPVRLLPGTYQFRLPFAAASTVFDFTVTAGGTIDYAPALDAFVSGRGTTSLIVLGHPIAIDTTAFQPTSGYQVLSTAVAVNVTATGGVENVRLLPGDYVIHLPYASATAHFDFTVTAAGTLDYAAALDAFVSGRGTSTLTVLGYPIAIDTTAIQSTSGYQVLSTTVAVNVTATGGINDVRLLPGAYQLHLPYASGVILDFTVTAAGTLDYAAALDAFVSGRGTSTLTVLGYPIAIDTTAIQPTSGYRVLSTTVAVDVTGTGGVNHVRLLPGAYQFEMPYASATAVFSFLVTSAGTIDFAPALDTFVAGRGTTTLTVLGHSIAIDTSVIQPTSGYQVLSTSLAVVATPTGGVENVRLLPGQYRFHLPLASHSASFDFTVTAGGVLDYSTALDGFVNGRGTSTLVVLGYPITVDTSALSASTYHIVSVTIAAGPTTAGGISNIRLLPGDYVYSSVFTFPFTLLANGTIDFDPAFEPDVTGRGTATLTVNDDPNTDADDALMVTNVNDSGAGSLRQAIVAANAAPDTNTIRFFIPGPGPHTITPLSPLPDIATSMIIDGTTQPGYLGAPVIELNGASAGILANGLHLTGGGATVRALAINRFIASGIAMMGGGANTVAGSYIGTDITGSIDRGNGGAGILIGPGSNGHVIGVPGVNGRNVISGNAATGISITTATGTVIRNNYIGVNAGGTAALGNSGDGVEVVGASGATIGGVTAGDRNVISGNTGAGVRVTGPLAPQVPATTILGNIIGLDATGTAPLGNSDIGVRTANAAVMVGGSAAGARNIISSNLIGVYFSNSGSTFNSLVQGNYIGTDITGTLARGNAAYGVAIGSAPGTRIGGDSPGAGNVISGNPIGVAIDAISHPVIDGLYNAIVEGNLIGLNAAGTAALGNNVGVSIGNGDNLIGGATAGSRNVISGSVESGVVVGAARATLQGNYIGTDITGAAAVANGLHGVHVLGPDATIGGLTAVPGTGAGNVISGNGGTGVLAEGPGAPSTPHPVIQGNIIGLDATGANQLGNGGPGVRTLNASVQVGGAAAGARNVIAANNFGVSFSNSGSTFNSRVQGNYIGTDITGTVNRGNGIGVVVASAPGTIVGGESPGEGNLISGQQTGVSIGNSSHPVIGGLYNAVVQGNLIGVNAAGTAALANNTGVLIANANNLIGGTSAGARNVISGSHTNGIFINAAGTNTTVRGNYIGTSASGTAAVPNTEFAMRVFAPSVIGGSAAGAGNLISGNASTAVYLEPAAGGTIIEGNRIGTDVTGAIGLGNTGPGIYSDQAVVTIGGAVAGAGNVVSGNNHVGIILNAVPSFAVRGNRVGTSADGLTAIPNNAGILVQGGGSGTIGGDNATTRNLISGNLGPGVTVSQGNGVFIEGNYIGLDATGNAALGNTVGVEIHGLPGVTTNIGVGDNPAGQGNVISGNAIGVRAQGGNDNRIENNLIGTNFDGTASVPNTSHGVLLTDVIGSATAYLVAGNTIAFNGGDGVRVTGTSSQNLIRSRIHLNGGSGIDLGGDGLTLNDALDADAGPNGLQNYPVLTNVTVSATDTTVSGTLHSTPNALFTVDLYSIAALDASGYGEGNVSFGSFIVVTDNLGNAVFSVPVPVVIPATNFVVATAIDAAGNTSEFSAGIPASTFLVTNTNDSGAGSLRAAMLSANATPGAQTVTFAIPGAGPHTIAPTAELPIIGDSMTIDGTTQAGYDGLPMVIVDGAGTPVGSSGFRLEGNGSIVRGLSVMNFGIAYGLLVRGSSNRVEQNLVGLDRFNTSGPNGFGVYLLYATTPLIAQNTIGASNSDGLLIVGGVDVTVENNVIGLTPDRTTSRGNSGNGITIYDGSQDTIIRGNTISSNLGHGIGIQQSGALVPVNQTRILNNVIGLGAAGVVFGNSLTGIDIVNGADTSVGEPGNGNTISGNGTHGVSIFNDVPAPVTVQANLIGTDEGGSAARPNTSVGVFIQYQAFGHTVGGSVLGDGNVVSGNGASGITVRGNNNYIAGNLVGVDDSGVVTLGNGDHGIHVEFAQTNLIQFNVIGGNTSSGIFVGGNTLFLPTPTVGTFIQQNFVGVAENGTTVLPNGVGITITESADETTVTQNQIYGNTGLGIDLNADGVTANDLTLLDADAGPNGLQNHPQITAVVNAATTEIGGFLDSQASLSYEIEAFMSPTCDGSGFGEGRDPLATFAVVTNAVGVAAISGQSLGALVPSGWFITLTARSPSGSTSEFSSCVVVP